jgi:hypothetical protein
MRGGADMIAVDRVAVGGALCAVLCVIGPAISAHAATTVASDNLELAGYVAPAPAGPVIRVHAQLTVPATLDCSTATSVVVDAAVRVTSSGAYPTTDLVGICDHGVASWAATGFGGEFPMTVSAGDTVAMTIRIDTSRPFHGEKSIFEDLTTGVTMARVTNLQIGSQPGVLVGMPVAGNINPQFGQLRWSKANVNNTALGSLNPQRYTLIEHPNHPKALIWTSALSPAGGAFTNTWASTGTP